ncbi:hypothetical protein DPMN_051320 [Dreissena polymorpha]|uniref:Uncharacterized protein n=1 Tax=Dreissena polymorpha TaxID=45954 RepID=A0A9D4CIS3_DREPO|nr:hypothetical protein DPMN_051320 [Dreissena polymorpha]
MRGDDTEILLQPGLLCAAESNSAMGGMSTLLHYPSSFSSSGLDVDLILACPGEQSCTESRACWRVQTKLSFVV